MLSLYAHLYARTPPKIFKVCNDVPRLALADNEDLHA